MSIVPINSERLFDGQLNPRKRLKIDTTSSCDQFPREIFPEDLIYEIFKHFAIGQPFRALFDRIKDGNEKVFPSLLFRVGLVSKKWRNALLKVFCNTKIPFQDLRCLKKKVDGEDVVKLASFCREHLSYLYLSDLSLNKICLTEKQWEEILPLIPNLRKLAIPLDIEQEIFSEIIKSTQLTTLSCYPGRYGVSPQLWESIKKADCLPNLISLKIRGITLNTIACAAICQIPSFTRLTCLDMSTSNFPDDFTLPAETVHLTDLKKLNLHNCNLQNLGSLASLVTPNLSYLNLSYNFFWHDEIVALSQSSLACAESLKISIQGTGNYFTASQKKIEPQSIEAIFNGFTRLQDLSIASVENKGVLGSEGADALAKHSAATQLKTLHLGSALLNNEGLRILLLSPYLTNVTDLNLADNPFDERGISAFEYSNIPLRYLVLDSNKFDMDSKAMQSLTKAAAATSLELLSFKFCNLPVNSQKDLRNASQLTRLSTLDLRGNFLEPSFFQELFKNWHFKNLKEIITDEGSIPYNRIC